LERFARREVHVVGQPSGPAARGLSEVIGDLSLMVASGVVGNAAWELLPHTARFLMARLRGAPDSIDLEGVVHVVVNAVRAAYGQAVAVRVVSAEQKIDGHWDCDLRVDETPIFIRVAGEGQLIMWASGQA
jgi:hypothetical protein